MNERCVYCKHFESTHEGAYGALGEDICSCQICNEDEPDCPDYEEIEREIAIEVLENAAEHYSRIDDCTEHSIRQCISTIKKIPTIDPIRAAGGCRCGECKFAKPSTHTGYLFCTGYNNPNYVVPNGGCLEGEPKEAQEDG